ncbi:hypothetical protein GCM10017673_43860 [Streptosporangium violaceochromogenes]|nr:hypothetical protein GCM10017673_43860 [Streptosporangium violaceochromogenes]
MNDEPEGRRPGGDGLGGTPPETPPVPGRARGAGEVSPQPFTSDTAVVCQCRMGEQECRVVSPPGRPHISQNGRNTL